MNQEGKGSRELRFVCPECGANSLSASVSGYLNIEHVYEGGLFTWGDLYPEDIGEYRCRDCGYELQFEEDEWVEDWLIAHCDQEKSEASQALEDNSAGLASNES